MSSRMDIKSLALILVIIALLGCTQTPVKGSKNVDLPEKTNAGSLPTKQQGTHASSGQLKLTSVLYDLTNAPEPERFAKKHGISLSNNMVSVFIYFAPDASIKARNQAINAHHIQVEKASKDLTRAWVPVQQLIPLSNEPAILMIGLPKTFIKTNGKSND